MQEGNFDIFDDRVRSLLDGAEVKAPRSVWRGVRVTLDAAASMWRWAAAGLAAACLLAGGLFLGGVFDRSSDISESPVLAQVAEPAPAPAPAPAEEPAPAPGNSIHKHIISTATAAVKAVAAEQTVPEVAQADDAAAAVPAVSAEPETAEQTPAPSEQQADAQPWSDPFAAMELEDRLASARKSRLALAVLGVAGGNDSNLGTYLGRSARMADVSVTPTRTGITELSTSSYDIPFAIGLGVRYNFTDRLSVGTGVTWSVLCRSFAGEYNEEYLGGILESSIVGDVDHTMHYIGIPLNLYFNAYQENNFKFYLFGGGSAEYCISNSYRIYGESRQMTYKEAVEGFQYSVSAGLGVEFGISDRIGVYFDPSARYYPAGNHPRSIRTDKPFMVNFEAGFRLNL